MGLGAGKCSFVQGQSQRVESVRFGKNEVDLIHSESLPFFAGSLAFLQQELQADRPRMERLNQGLANEPSLSARLLVLANQRWPSSCSHISSVLALFSLEDLRAALSGVMGSPYANGVTSDGHYLVWRKYCVDVALAARSLARDLLFNEQLAYSAGLLHAIHMVLPPNPLVVEATAASKKHSDLALLRDQAFPLLSLLETPCDFRQSGLLMQHWGLPEELTEVVKECEEPFSNDAITPLAAVLHLAIWRVCIATLGMEHCTLSYPAEIALSLDMDMDMVLHQEPIRWK